MSGLALVAQCNKRVGSGHAVETSHLLRCLSQVECRAYLTKGTPRELLRRFRSSQLIPDLSVESLSSVAVDARSRGYKAAVLNALQVTPAMVKALKSSGLKVAALSVNRRVRGADLSLTLGPKNMILAPEFARLARRPRRHRGPLREIMILMGGTDNSGTTASVARTLAGHRPRLRKTIIVGPNFAHPAELTRVLAAVKDPSFRVIRGPKNLPALMRRADAALTLGSDTSLELACVGTPTILFEEASHERRQALLLASRGCGLYAGSRPLLPLLARLDDAALRNRMSRAGRSFVDGLGAERLARALKRLAV
ncbi:MAG: hypothetical protein AAB036_00090 [Elusimicrobiota bacterium]